MVSADRAGLPSFRMGGFQNTPAQSLPSHQGLPHRWGKALGTINHPSRPEAGDRFQRRQPSLTFQSARPALPHELAYLEETKLPPLKRLVLQQVGLMVQPRAHIERYEAALPYLPKSWEGATVVQISDLHIHGMDRFNHWKQVSKAINDLQPDLIVFTGDTVQEGTQSLMALHDFLASLPQDIPKVGVMGNHDYKDHGNPPGEHSRKVLKANGFKILHNEAIALKRNPDDPDALWISGIDDKLRGKPDHAKAFEGIPPQQAHVFLTHNPETLTLALAEEKENLPHLVLAGHFHGGQINIEHLDWPIPFFGLFKRFVMAGKRWLLKSNKDPIYGVDELREGRTLLYTSSGSGSGAVFSQQLKLKRWKIPLKFHIPPMRLGSQSEIVAFTLKTAPDDKPNLIHQGSEQIKRSSWLWW